MRGDSGDENANDVQLKMAAQSETNEDNANIAKKRRGRYLSYLSYPLEKVPRISRYRMEQSIDASLISHPQQITETLLVDCNHSSHKQHRTNRE